MRNKDELITLCGAIFFIIEENKGTSFDKEHDYLLHAEPLAQKIAANALSVLYLTDGTKPSLKDIPTQINFTDYPSIFAIIRSAFESYLTFFHIFSDSTIDDEERSFRYKLWHASSLSHRQRYTPITKKVEELLQKEAQELEELLVDIKSSKFFTVEHITKRAKEDIKAGRDFDWKPKGGWAGIAAEASISESYFDDLYNHLSSVSHSDAVLAYQFKQDDMKAVQQGFTDMGVMFLNVILTLLIRDYAKLFPKSEQWLKGQDGIKQLTEVNSWIASNYPKSFEEAKEEK